MNLSFGIAVFSGVRNSEEDSSLIGLWYYKENYVPITREQKLDIQNDIKSNRCKLFQINGTFTQISELLNYGDDFINCGPIELSKLKKLTQLLYNSTGNLEVFDDILNLKGTSISIDTYCEIEETMDEVMEQLKGKMVVVNIQKDWSFNEELLKQIRFS